MNFSNAELEQNQRDRDSHTHHALAAYSFRIFSVINRNPCTRYPSAIHFAWRWRCFNHPFEAAVGATERLGSETLIHLHTGDGTKLTAVLTDDVELQKDNRVLMNFDTKQIRVFYQ